METVPSIVLNRANTPGSYPPEAIPPPKSSPRGSQTPSQGDSPPQAGTFFVSQCSFKPSRPRVLSTPASPGNPGNADLRESEIPMPLPVDPRPLGGWGLGGVAGGRERGLASHPGALSHASVGGVFRDPNFGPDCSPGGHWLPDDAPMRCAAQTACSHRLTGGERHPSVDF